jgi:hypothetical protein
MIILILVVGGLSILSQLGLGIYCTIRFTENEREKKGIY